MMFICNRRWKKEIKTQRIAQNKKITAEISKSQQTITVLRINKKQNKTKLERESLGKN